MKIDTNLPAQGLAPMPFVLGDLDSALSGLHERVDTLVDRLRPVLTPRQETKVDGQSVGAVRAEKSPVVMAIENRTARVLAIEARIAGLLADLEV